MKIGLSPLGSNIFTCGASENMEDDLHLSADRFVGCVLESTTYVNYGFCFINESRKLDFRPGFMGVSNTPCVVGCID